MAGYQFFEMTTYTTILLYATVSRLLMLIFQVIARFFLYVPTINEHVHFFYQGFVIFFLSHSSVIIRTLGVNIKFFFYYYL